MLNDHNHYHFLCDRCKRVIDDFEIIRFNNKIYCTDCNDIIFGHKLPKPKGLEIIKDFLNKMVIRLWYFFPK